MCRRFIISAVGLSHPGTMGGNSKIALELIRTLSVDYPVIVFTTTDKLPTITQNIALSDAVQIHAVPPFEGHAVAHPLREARYYARQMARLLEQVNAGAADHLFSCCDFLVDVLPAFLLKPRFRFKWIPSVFLFVPFVIENIRRQYRFPVLKYLIYYVYQRIIFLLIKARGDLFVITNDCDKRYFPPSLRPRVFAFYGGVNTEQIREVLGTAEPVPGNRYDVVFCGRLHPQKGIMKFLDVWQRVLAARPAARLAVIGNGAARYERQLRQKAVRLGSAPTIDWLGYINNQSKYRVYMASRVFAHPTLYDNNGMVAAEALCSGLPVIMYDLPNLRSLYRTGCTKVPEGDQAAYATAIIRLLADSAAYAAARPSPGDLAALQNNWSWRTRVNGFLEFVRAH